MKGDANTKSESAENSVFRLHSKITSANAGSSGSGASEYSVFTSADATRNERPADLDRKGFPIEIVPLQSDQLRASHPGAEGQDHHGVTRFPVHRSDENCELLGSENSRFPSPLRTALDSHQRHRITVRGQVLPQHGAIEDPMHEPLDMASRFAGQWTLAFFVQDCFEPVANGQRFYLG